MTTTKPTFFFRLASSVPPVDDVYALASGRFARFFDGKWRNPRKSPHEARMEDEVIVHFDPHSHLFAWAPIDKEYLQMLDKARLGELLDMAQEHNPKTGHYYDAELTYNIRLELVSRANKAHEDEETRATESYEDRNTISSDQPRGQMRG